MGLSGDHGRLIKWHQPDNFAFVERSRTMKAPVGLLSDRTVLRSKMEGLCPDKFAFVERSRTMKAPAGLLSDRTVLRSKMEGLCPTSPSLLYSFLAGFGADALQQEHYRSPTNVRTLTPNSNDQRHGIIMAMVSCLWCYICLFFHGRVWYTRLSSTNRYF